MPVDTTHIEYDEAFESWKTVRDCVAGERVIKEATNRYLPKLGDQEKKSYEAYLARAIFFNATKKAHRAWRGMVFRKEVKVKIPSTLKIYEQDADLLSNGIAEYIEGIGEEIMSVGRAGTLIDWNEEENRSFFDEFTAERVINWKPGRLNGRIRLVSLTLHETVQDHIDFENAPESEDEFVSPEIDQWRIYRLEQAGFDQGRPIYQVVVSVYRKDKDGNFVLIDLRIPTRRGIGLPDIPFVFHNARNERPGVGEVPLEDIANLNLAHYRTTADLENGRHIAGIPTPWAVGFTDQNTTSLTMGANEVWVSNKQFAKAGFLEFTGAGLASLEKSLEEKEKQMAFLGVRAIAPENGDAEAFETVKMRGTSETANLTTMAKSVQRGITDALKWAAWWHGSETHPSEVTSCEVEINTDFLAALIDPAMLTSLTNALMAGSISFPTYFNRLKDGEVYEESMTMEAELEAIRENPMMPEPEPDPDPDPNKPKPGEE